LGLSENGGSPNNVWDIQTLGESIWEIWSPTRSSFFGLTVTIRSGKNAWHANAFLFCLEALGIVLDLGKCQPDTPCGGFSPPDTPSWP
jgi:hypothetical protein